MARNIRETLRRSELPFLSREDAISVLMRCRYDLIDIIDQDAFCEEIAAHTRSYLDAGALLDA